MPRSSTSSAAEAPGPAGGSLPERTFEALIVAAGVLDAAAPPGAPEGAVLRSLAAAGTILVRVPDRDPGAWARAVAELADAGVTGETVLLIRGCGARRPAFRRSGRLVVACAGLPHHAPVPGVAHLGGPEAVLELADAQVARRGQHRVPHVDRDPAWTIPLPAAGPDRRRAGSLGAQTNGRCGTGAGLEEGGPAGPVLFLVGGAYDGSGALQAGPDWTAVGWTGPGGDRPPGGPDRFLDLRSGALVRLATPAWPLSSVRVVSAADPHTLVMRCETPGDARVTGHPFRAPRPRDGLSVAPAAEPGAGPRVQVATAGGRGGTGICVAAADTCTGGPGWTTVERLAAWAAGAGGRHRARTRLAAVSAAGFDRLWAAHIRARARMWAGAGVSIEGSPDDELAVRFAVHHLLGAAAGPGESAVGARGLTGDAYAGHVFWDADVFVLPALAAIGPAAARAMLEYRIRRLPAARRAARAAGLDGARFPWESAGDGTDVTPDRVRGRGGQVVPVRTGRNEIHVVADVAWAAHRYAEWTGDREFLTAGPGRELMVDTARFWASRIRVDRDGRGHLYGVMGPDEYHEVVDDNAFTNVMARWNLRRAAGIVLGDHPPRAERAGEAARWLSLAEGLVDGWDPGRRTFEQFAGYFGLEGLVVEDVTSPPSPWT